MTQLISRQDFCADSHRCVSYADDSSLLTHSIDFMVDEVGKLFAKTTEKMSNGKWTDSILIEEKDILFVADKKSINYEQGVPSTAEPMSKALTPETIIKQLGNRTLLVSHVKLNGLPVRSYILLSPA